MKTIKTSFFFIFFILILGIVLFKIFINPSLFEKPFVYTPAPVTDKKGIECEKSGGEWITGPFGKEFFCNNKMADGGKICKSNLDCLSDTCIVDESDNVARCATYKNANGCYIKLVKGRNLGLGREGRIVRQKICVD